MSAHATLRRRYPLLLQVGLLAALALGVTAFSIPLSFGEDVTVVATDDEFIPPIEIEATDPRPEPPKPKPPAPIEVPDTEVETEIVIDLEKVLTKPAELPALPAPPAPTAEPLPPPVEDDIFVVVEQAPTLIGGLAGLQSRIQYPELARRAGIEGTVFVQFVVDEGGSVHAPVCLRDPGGGTCDEALRAVRASTFEPGRQRGKPVKVRLSLPVKFRLR